MRYIGIILISILLFSCGKKLGEKEQDFIGIWKGSKDGMSYTIRIEEDSKARFSWVGDGDMRNFEGNARIRGEVLRIAGHRLIIQERPYVEDDFFFMKVNDVVYQRFDFQ